MDGFRVVEATDNDWSPGPGFYIVGPEYDGIEQDKYLAYCGPFQDESSQLDAELIASLLNASRS
jgi:hypothetical protein